MTTEAVTDALVIGAGPAGLFLAFELGLLGISCHIVDAQEHPGGQAATLYGDKPIYDIPALPRVTGQELTERLLEQLRPFAPAMHLGEEITTLAAGGDDGGWRLTTSRGSAFHASCVFIAAGVGAFAPRRLKLEGIEALEGSQVFHWRPTAGALSGQRVLVVGGDELALDRIDSLLADASPPASITLMHRRAVVQAPAETLARFEAQCAQGRVRFEVGQVSGLQIENGRLSAVDRSGPDGDLPPLAVDAVVVAQGMSPRLGPLADWGLVLERKQLPVDPANFGTALPGVFAVGDIVQYPGKKKLILSAFHEATLAAFAAADLLDPARSQVLQYTSSSSLLQGRLQV
ncbi:NAD(P)/FAD-dependent oxidoreductase [Xylophilus sp. GOD-11R]|uniref:NAD(P)/FAD-dependent oxidoreductase n=1 Tax=Xylophilus sp. GOD-11R TaxID=3089814 RepID=UPI00298C1E88|nr:NAD(P)/FAD-dependent oxidoreductase [Xylophilus sp. GOD-11R]WPB59133.1 NAD(P)/FAD-dependent oxidoreductase [Xylophilus sp. GOD-11R]